MDKKKIISIIIIVASFLICIVSVVGIIISNRNAKNKKVRLEPLTETTTEAVSEAVATMNEPDKEEETTETMTEVPTEEITEASDDKTQYYTEDNPELTTIVYKSEVAPDAVPEISFNPYNDIILIDRTRLLNEEFYEEMKKPVVDDIAKLAALYLNYDGTDIEGYKTRINESLIPEGIYPSSGDFKRTDAYINFFNENHIKCRLVENIPIIIYCKQHYEGEYKLDIKGFAYAYISINDEPEKYCCVPFTSQVVYKPGEAMKYFVYNIKGIGENYVKITVDRTDEAAINMKTDILFNIKLEEYETEQ